MSLADGLCAVILAGGKGTRLRSVVSDRPKVLAPVLGRPFLAYQIWALSKLGFAEAVISSGYMADMVAEVLGPERFGVKLIYSPEDKPLGTGGGLRLAAGKTDKDFFFVLNGDSFVDVDMGAFISWFSAGGFRAGMLLAEVEDTARYGRVELSPNGAVTRFCEKGLSGPGSINAGVYLLSREIVESMPLKQPFSLETGLFPKLVPDVLRGYPVKASFIDIGTPESYARAERFFARCEL